MGLLAMIPKLVERILLHVTLSFKWVCQIVHGSASHDPQVSRSGSARLSMGLLAMITILVERVLLHVLPSIKWVCQIFHGSAGADPLIYKGGSATLVKGLLAMIPKTVKSGSARGLLPMIPIN